MNLSRNKPVQNASQAKKLSVMKIRKICVSEKALREEVVPERGSGELAGTSKVYLDSCNSEYESIKCCSSLSTSVIKRSVRNLLIYLVKRKKLSRDKYAVLRVRWYEYVREVLKSWEARKLVHNSWKDGDIAQSMVVGQRKNVRIDVWIIIVKQIAAIELAIDVTEGKKKEKVCLVISNENNYV